MPSCLPAASVIVIVSFNACNVPRPLLTLSIPPTLTRIVYALPLSMTGWEWCLHAGLEWQRPENVNGPQRVLRGSAL